MHRRRFLAATAALTATATAPRAFGRAPAHGADGAPKFRRAVKSGMVRADGPRAKFALAQACGFDAIEINDRERDVPAILAAKERTGLPVHGVTYGAGWRDRLSDPDDAVRRKGVEGLKSALRDSRELGGTTVLVVPGVVDENAPYADVYERSQRSIRECLPVAEETGVRMLFENVWNNFLLSPLEMARYIDEFESPLVGAYFDVGNVVHYGWPEQWIRTLGRRIGKLDIKEFSRDLAETDGARTGFRAPLGEGSVDWAAVRTALDEIGFTGWATAEVPGGGKDRLTEIHRRMGDVLGL